MTRPMGTIHSPPADIIMFFSFLMTVAVHLCQIWVFCCSLVAVITDVLEVKY